MARSMKMNTDRPRRLQRWSTTLDKLQPLEDMLDRCAHIHISNDTRDHIRDCSAFVWKALAAHIAEGDGGEAILLEQAVRVLAAMMDMTLSDEQAAVEKDLTSTLVQQGARMLETAWLFLDSSAADPQPDALKDGIEAMTLARNFLQASGEQRNIEPREPVHVQRARVFYMTFAQSKLPALRAALKSLLARFDREGGRALVEGQRGLCRKFQAPSRGEHPQQQ